MGRKFRIGTLLLVLVAVTFFEFADRWRTTSWSDTLSVIVYPMAADDSPATRVYLDGFDLDQVSGIETWIQRQAAVHGVDLERPVRFYLAPEVPEAPPAFDPHGSLLGRLWWSLQLRRYASRMEDEDGLPRTDVQLFLRFHDPDLSPRLAHSIGLQKGLVGVVELFASPRDAGSNRVVIAHELLHTLGAQDRYEPGSALPLFPEGYAEPEKRPVYPQRLAEIMAGRIPVSATDAEIPEDLDRVIVGPLTAAEIGWD